MLEYDDGFALAEHLKNLEDDALLDFWEETHTLDAPFAGLCRQSAVCENQEGNGISFQKELENMFEFALYDTVGKLQIFAIPMDSHMERRCGNFWGFAARGHESIVLRELQMRNAQRLTAKSPIKNSSAPCRPA
jgi:hypothetical protein